MTLTWDCLASSGTVYFFSMQLLHSSFENSPAYDEDGRLVIKSTCKRAAFQLVNVRDGSLTMWEARYECSR